jgi:hypothetical protein
MMADTQTQGQDESKSAEAVAPTISPVALPAATTRLVVAARSARPLIGSEPKRLSKGQRKHMRRQKQAGEYKIIDRR